jgi:hypothetical protein
VAEQQPELVNEPASDKRFGLVYDAAVKRLSMQDTTFGNIRTQANNLLATAALFTSLSAGVGLINTDATKGAVLSPAKVDLLLAVVVLLGLRVLYILLPVRGWIFGPSAEKIMQKYDDKEDEASIRKFVIRELIEGIKTNNTKLNSRLWAFRGAAFLLVCEVGLLVSLLTLRK